MIIKIISGKGDVSGVVRYIATDKGRITDHRNTGVYHNLHSTDLKGIIQEYRNNYKVYGKKRANGNTYLHIILSINPLDRDKINAAKMEDITRTYLARAFPNALAFSVQHVSNRHYHAHAVVSANELMSGKSTRLSKKELKKIHLDMVEYVKNKYSEITSTIDIQNWGKRLHLENEYYLKQRNPDLITIKSQLTETIQHLFRSSESSQEFFKKLTEAGYKTYIHQGKVFGIYWGEKNYKMRFARLGLELKLIEALDTQHKRLQELRNIRSHREQPKIRDISRNG